MRNYLSRGTRLAVVAAVATIAMPLSLLAPSIPAAAASQIGGRVTSQPGSTAPTSFTFHRANGLTATINVSSSTVVLRRYGGHTDIGTVSVGDALQIRGTFEAGGTTFDATQVRDLSIQASFAYGRGKVLSVDTSANTLTAKITGGLFAGTTVTINVPSGRTIPLPQGGTTTLSSLQVGDTIFVRGVYNRSSKMFTGINALRVLKVVSAPTIQPASVSVGGFAFHGHHFEVILVHTVASAAVQVQIHVQNRTITVSGTANSSGNFQTVRQIGYGTWSSSQHVQTILKLSTSSAQRTLTRWNWMA